MRVPVAGLHDSTLRVLQRLNLRTLLIAHGIGLVWFALPFIWSISRPNPPATFVYSIAVIAELTVVFVLLAILIADEAVRRGAWRSLAYPVAIVVAAAAIAFAQWHVRGWFGFQTWVNRPGVNPALQLTQMLNLFMDVTIYGGLVIFIYVNGRRDRELMRQTQEAELARAHSEQTLLQVRLATALAEANPAELLARMRRIHELFVVNSSVADQALDDFTRELRTQLGSDGDRREPARARATA